MEQSAKSINALRMGIAGAAFVMIGILLSGPLGMIVVNQIHPQPSWQGARIFAENFHMVQTFPFLGGIALVIGFVVLMAAIHRLASDSRKTASLISVILTSAFATLIFFNYINQTTFVPALARDYKPEYESLISAFSFSNPVSLCWAIEMWGYGLLGLATWIASAVFDRNRLEKITGALMIFNGILSIAGALIASYDLRWVFTTAGFVSYTAWNIVVFVLAICIIASLRRRQTQNVPSGG